MRFCAFDPLPKVCILRGITRADLIFCQAEKYVFCRKTPRCCGGSPAGSPAERKK
nr:MAG TPA: hypothetical protein [Caudoviricetes sp.]